MIYKKSNQSGFTALDSLLIILIIVLIGSVGYLVYRTQPKVTTTYKVRSNNSTVSVKKQTTRSVVTSHTTNNPYQGWKTFCSAFGGLCLKYPTNWTFKQTLTKTVVAETDIINSPAGDLSINYYPNTGTGPTGDNSDVYVYSVNPTQSSYFEVVGLVVKSLDSPTGYVPELFVTSNNINSYNYYAGQSISDTYFATVPIFTSPKINNGKYLSLLDVELANQNSQLTGFNTEAQAQDWFTLSQVKVAKQILESVSLNTTN